jgi:hypothetical protein
VTEKLVSQRETAELKYVAKWQIEATDEDEEDGMGDHSDLPNSRKFLQLRRLQEQGQPWEQLDAVIDEIRKLMLGSARTTSEKRLGREEEATAAQQKQQQQQDGADENWSL